MYACNNCIYCIYIVYLLYIHIYIYNVGNPLIYLQFGDGLYTQFMVIQEFMGLFIIGRRYCKIQCIYIYIHMQSESKTLGQTAGNGAGERDRESEISQYTQIIVMILQYIYICVWYGVVWYSMVRYGNICLFMCFVWLYVCTVCIVCIVMLIVLCAVTFCYVKLCFFK